MTSSYAQNKRRARSRRSRSLSWNSSVAKSVKKIAASGVAESKRVAVKRSNPARKAKAFKRAYGSRARVAFVKSLPCVACGVVGYSENAHVTSGGVGRKADASQIVPLCGPHHLHLHAWGIDTWTKHYRKDLHYFAMDTEQRWQSHITGVSA